MCWLMNLCSKWMLKYISIWPLVKILGRGSHGQDSSDLACPTSRIEATPNHWAMVGWLIAIVKTQRESLSGARSREKPMWCSLFTSCSFSSPLLIRLIHQSIAVHEHIPMAERDRSEQRTTKNQSYYPKIVIQTSSTVSNFYFLGHISGGIIEKWRNHGISIA